MKSDGDLRGDADCHSQCAHWLRNDTLYEMRYESGRAAARVAPTERNKKCHGRGDVGSELSAAGGRGSEVSEWPRSKF